MDWFFGCFGGAGKKARKHGASQKVSERPIQPFPVKVTAPASIALKAFAVKEEATNHEGLLQERQLSTSSMLARNTEGVLCERNSETTPEKPQKGGPWSQLDDLEEELEDLRKQIEKETLDTKKIKEEVTFLRSCGTLLQTPVELRKKDTNLETQQGITPLKSWHSWFVPSSPTAKLQFTELQLQAEHPCSNIPHCVQAPIIEKKKEENGQTASFSMLGQEKQEGVHSHFNTVATQQGGVDCDSNIASIHCKKEVIGLVKLCNQTPTSDNSIAGAEVLPASSKVESHVSNLCSDNAGLMCENFASHPKRLKIPTTTDAAKEAEKIFKNLGHIEPTHTFGAVQAPFSEEADNFRSKTTVLDAKRIPQSTRHRYDTEESNNCASYMMPQSPFSSSGLMDDSGETLKPSPLLTSSSYDEHCAAFEEISHSKQDGYSGRGYKKSSSYDRHDDSQLNTLDSCSSSSTNNDETLTDLSAENSFLLSEIQTPQESNTSCKVEDSPATFHVEETASLHSYGSTQLSVAQSGWRLTQAARYACEYEEREDDNLSSDAISHASVECSQNYRYKQFSGYTARIARQEDQNFIETPFKVSQWIATPEFPRSPRLRSRPASPVLTPIENALQWQQLKKAKDCLESNQQEINSSCNIKASYKIHNFDSAKASTERQRSRCAAEGMREESWGENEHGVCMNSQRVHLFKEQGDKFKPGSRTGFASYNMSLSQWLTPSPNRGGTLESPTPLLRNHKMPHGISVETASSLWTPMHANACGEMVVADSSGTASEALPTRVDMSLSNWLNSFNQQNQARCSEVTPIGLVRHGSRFTDPNERPILGVISSDNDSNSSAARTAQWDGKGIPNTTTKYKEDSRVSWHASPFEIRLERALNEQGEVLQMKGAF